MNEQLVNRMREYLNAGLDMDVDKLDALYDDAFENLRVDAAGRSVVLTKPMFMARFRALKEQGQAIGDSIDDVTFPGTTVFGDTGVILMRRVQDGETSEYTFIWRMADGRPATILREITHDKDVSYLIEMLANAGANA